MHSLPNTILIRVFALILAVLCASCSLGQGPLFGGGESDAVDQPAVEKQSPARVQESYRGKAEASAYTETEDSRSPAPTAATRSNPAAPAAKPVSAKPQTTRIALRDNVPERYTVKKGDTLWDIAALFLKDPWLWPEIWYFNPQIDNPHLIYPGDVLILVYVNGQPQLRVVRDGEALPTDTTTTTPTVTQTTPRMVVPEAPRGLRTQKLSPRIREESLEKAIPTIPVSVIEPFLIKPRVVTKKELRRAPYVVSSLDRHLATAEGHTIYVRNLKSDEDVRYNIFRPGAELRDPRNGKVLGYETILVSEAKLVRLGDPATLEITRSLRETLDGDRVLPAEDGKISYNFLPREPKHNVEGEIIWLVDSLFQTAQRQVVIVNLGQRAGMEIGTVLAIEQRGGSVQDSFADEGFNRVELPNERAGLLMIFRVFDRVSYGLIMESKRAVHLNDIVRNPTPQADLANED
ncbi:MAG TPA: LysM peptidoglycan-binding domain-containing protein [Gammaproteobacteria bacterium]|nr:LysM peptidoglycan-binding domain-containing protein [Gammaproteobacteria bacterium]